ncbi:uncharacterized protein ANIA_11383 [Aspergillus nidulans FGSC A4]|uniref:Uncharacterized protein n=1 Tax=Emericella nidulans (strain FGSC A4 / ATCC 38163 / CBS 112.46 / NRRL 194 / M139) TaxID=227321 RepID=C8VHY6_EMENI|nr:hypothetical protein [Aspergillus nidulans FGSC A4]CBF82974.1 TPA: hypothetical protein ANIA_11383 [Aspergillus nidulans FGSC A4]
MANFYIAMAFLALISGFPYWEWIRTNLFDR